MNGNQKTIESASNESVKQEKSVSKKETLKGKQKPNKPIRKEHSIRKKRTIKYLKNFKYEPMYFMWYSEKRNLFKEAKST